MAGGNGGRGNGRWTQIVVGATAAIVTVVSLVGLNGSVRALEGRVDRLEVVSEQIDAIEEQLSNVQREATELGHLREDILAAICIANARTRSDVARCNRSSGRT